MGQLRWVGACILDGCLYIGAGISIAIAVYLLYLIITGG